MVIPATIFFTSISQLTSSTPDMRYFFVISAQKTKLYECIDILKWNESVCIVGPYIKASFNDNSFLACKEALKTTLTGVGAHDRLMGYIVTKFISGNN